MFLTSEHLSLCLYPKKIYYIVPLIILLFICFMRKIMKWKMWNKMSRNFLPQHLRSVSIHQEQEVEMLMELRRKDDEWWVQCSGTACDQPIANSGVSAWLMWLLLFFPCPISSFRLFMMTMGPSKVADSNAMQKMSRGRKLPLLLHWQSSNFSFSLFFKENSLIKIHLIFGRSHLLMLSLNFHCVFLILVNIFIFFVSSYFCD